VIGPTKRQWTGLGRKQSGAVLSSVSRCCTPCTNIWNPLQTRQMACSAKPTLLVCIFVPLPAVDKYSPGWSDPDFWGAIFSTDATSTEGLSNIAALVHSHSNITTARGLRGDQVQDLINVLDLVSDSTAGCTGADRDTGSRITPSR